MAAFFDCAWVWWQIRHNGRATRNWFVLGVLASIGFYAVNTIPVLGPLVNLTLQVPVQGHLIGQYAAVIDANGDVPPHTR